MDEVTLADWDLRSLEALWCALKRVAESGLSDFTRLRESAKSMSLKNRPLWEAFLDEQQVRIEDRLRNGFAPAPAFYRLLKALNERWFIPRRMLISRSCNSIPLW